MERYDVGHIRGNLDPLNTRQVVNIWFDTGFLQCVDEDELSKLSSNYDLSKLRGFRDRISTCTINPKEKDKYLLFASNAIRHLPDFEITTTMELCGSKFNVYKYTNYNLYTGNPEYMFILSTQDGKTMMITYLNDLR